MDHLRAAMPRLPLPKLQATCKKYLDVQRVFLSEDEFADTERKVHEFLNNEGPSLYLRLHGLRRTLYSVLRTLYNVHCLVCSIYII